MDARWLLSRASESGAGWLSTVILLERVAQYIHSTRTVNPGKEKVGYVGKKIAEKESFKLGVKD